MTPIPKEGDICNLSNYRPISVLPVFARYLKKQHIHRCMITWKITRSCINNNMKFVLKSLFFILVLSIFYTQAILHFLQYLYKHIDFGNSVFSLFLDFQKAFDCVNHQILLSKVNTYVVRGIVLDWFHLYLTNREQLCIYK